MIPRPLNSNRTMRLNRDLLGRLAKEYGTPFYYYDEAILVAQAATLRKLFGSNSFLYFASFCNSNPWLLKLFKECGIGILVSSSAELILADKVGFHPKEITVTGPPFSEEELSAFLERQILVNLDSLAQIKMAGNLRPGAQIGLRVNVDPLKCKGFHQLPLNSCLGPSSRVGILEEEISQAIKLASQYNLKVVALHSYSGTNQLEANLLLEVFQRLLTLAEGISSVQLVNLGGGFGVSYNRLNSEFPWESFAESALKTLATFNSSHRRALKLCLEPGRTLIASAGLLVSKVLDVKRRKDGSVFVTVDAALSNFPRPYIYKELGQHAVSLVTSRDRFETGVEIVVCGNSLASGDRLAERVDLQFVPEVNEYLVFHDAGAYGYSMSSTFAGRVRPPEVLVGPRRIKCIRERESKEVLLNLTGFDHSRADSYELDRHVVGL